MAQPFKNAVMPRCGIKLLNDAQAGECKIEFTRIAVGNGIYQDAEKERDVLYEATALKNEKKSYDIRSKEKVNNNSIVLSCSISNYDEETQKATITEGFYINEIAVFAKAVGTNNEILYSIAVTSGATGDYMPPYNGYNPATIIQSYVVSVNNAGDAKIEIKPGVYALQIDVDRQQSEIDDINTRLGGVSFNVRNGIPYLTYEEGEEEPDDLAPVINEDNADEIVDAIFGYGEVEFYTDDSTLQGNEATQEDINTIIEDIF